MPRPTKLTPSIQEGIVNAVRVGTPLSTAAGFVGVAPATVNEWLARGTGVDPQRETTRLYAAFAAAITRARSEDEIRRLARLEQAGRGGAVLARTTTRHLDGSVTTHEHFAPPDWRADAWVLERSRPEQWGRKERLDLRLSIERAAEKVAGELGLTVEEVLAEARALLKETDDERS
jgi:hypothetical protein